MKTHDNRGASAGVIDLSKLPSYANDMKQFTKKMLVSSGSTATDPKKPINS